MTHLNPYYSEFCGLEHQHCWPWKDKEEGKEEDEEDEQAEEEGEKDEGGRRGNNFDDGWITLMIMMDTDICVTAANRPMIDQGCDGFVKHANMTFVSSAFQKQEVNTSKEVNMTCSNI